MSSQSNQKEIIKLIRDRLLNNHNQESSTTAQQQEKAYDFNVVNVKRILCCIKYVKNT